MARLRALWCRIRGYHRSYYRMPPSGVAPAPWATPTEVTYNFSDLSQGLPCVDCGKEQEKVPLFRLIPWNHKPYKWFAGEPDMEENRHD